MITPLALHTTKQNAIIELMTDVFIQQNTQGSIPVTHYHKKFSANHFSIVSITNQSKLLQLTDSSIPNINLK